MLSELETFYVHPFGGIERDLHVRKHSKVKGFAIVLVSCAVGI